MWLLAALSACTPTALLDPAALPPETPGVVLLATASTTLVTVGGTVVTEQYVDIDEPTDDRDGFRYQILDGAGEVIYERTTNGPMVVQAFLGYWSDAAGVDLLDNLPVLGRFPLHVPLLPEGREVRFQLRDETGAYREAGSYDLAYVEGDDMGTYDLVTGFETLHSSGPSSNRMDLVILGDGYTAEEQGLFAEHADRVAEALLAEPPYDTLAPFINIHRVDTPSAESGASFDGPTAGPRDTAFGSIFAVELINRLTGGNYNSVAVFQSKQWEVAQAASVVPWDTAIVLINTPKFGGMAVHVASATTGFDGFERTAIHEMGHSFGLLGDEYAYDACIQDPRLGLPVNITRDPQDPPWAHWIDDDVPLPTPSTSSWQGHVGAFSPAYNCGDLYRPRQNCTMRDSTRGFCPVCTEQIVRRVFRFADPVDGLSHGRMEGPVENVELEWSRDGEVFATSAPGERVRHGKRPFEVRATYVTDRVRVGLDDLTQVYRYAP